MSYIEFQNINKFYGKNQVLKDISLNIEKGQFVTLLWTFRMRKKYAS